MTRFRTQRNQFPRDFLFGVATAAYQIEGSRLAGHAQSQGQGFSHWDSFSATRGNSHRGDTGAVACDHLGRWATDLDLIADAGFDSYRFSVSWPRLFPDGTGARNQAGWDFYDRLIDAMLARGIKPNATLYHWDLPSGLADRGGWLNRDIGGWFADYAAAVAARFGDRLDMLATINEPWCVSYLSHLIGAHAPGHRDIRSAARSMHHVLYAHGMAIDAMRSAGTKTPLGIVLNLQAYEPRDDSDDAHWAAHRLDGIFNRWFLDGVLNGTYPADMVAALTPWLPDNFQDDMALVAAPMDWLGINYYTRELAAKSADPRFPGIELCRGDLPKTAIGWEEYPQGLATLLQRVSSQYENVPPLYITENGRAQFAPDQVQGRCEDAQRVAFFDQHLAVCAQAIANGVDLRGYFAWSLMDNFEWAEGYVQRFGMVHVDFDTQTRTPKDSYLAFQAFLANDTASAAK